LRANRIAFAVLVIVFTGTGLSAHRLDEYLQAARLAVEPGRVELQLDLTPGRAVADAIIADIDRDRDGRLSPAEQREYAQRVFDTIELRIDDRPLGVGPLATTFPDLQLLRQGEGSIRLRTEAHLPRTLNGEHRLAFRNRHRPDISVYLANALLPDGDSVAITAQRRDPAQRDLTIDYVVRSEPAAAGSVWLLGLGAMLLTAVLNYCVRTSRMAGRMAGHERAASRMADVAQG
jgi:hypothetical protein